MWDKTSVSKGFFEAKPYNEILTSLKKCDLRDITNNDTTGFEKQDKNTGTIYNRFAEILRRYTISDKSNAYNKIFNLFLCKIVDEIETGDNEDLQFQWNNGEDAIDVLSRLNVLYKKGMDMYLNLEITDHKWEEIENNIYKVNSNKNAIDKLKQIFDELRLYKNNDFAFQEVINKTTFEKNAEIVEKVVKLLQPYRLKYSDKQQFIGDFFEKLLNVGIKQENGQFFTPVPIARFINYCIPYENIIEEKINKREANCLPKVIDYACGSGHFLTEAMDRLQKQIDIEATKNHNANIQDKLDNWKTKANGSAYSWANDFIFGIEKDYRLAKTTKIACFLNGDGDANVLYADGLASFDNPIYENKIKEEGFDVVIANPPYSVKCFRGVLQNKDFELYDKITNNSSNIECLFVERTKQLLRNGGMCGIILPSSILTNGGIADETRKMFMQNFDLIGIQELFENIFASTGTTTVILFAKRKDKTTEYQQIQQYIKNFINTQQDFAYNNNNNVIDAYCKYTNTTKEELLQALKDNDKSLEKLTLFISNYNKKCVISTYKNKKNLGKQFIGFEYSTRKGHEGLRPYPENKTGKVISQLYTDDNILDNQKVNYYFYNAFKQQYPEVHENLKDNVKYVNVNDLFNFDKKEFDYSMNTHIRPRQYVKNGEKLEKLVKELQTTQLLTNELAELNIEGTNEVKLLPSSKDYDWNTTFEKCNNNYNEGEIFTLGQARYANIKYWNGKYISSNNHIFTSIDNNKVLTKYVYYLIKDKTTNFYKTGQQYPQFNFEMFNNFQIPLPPLQTQQQIISKFEEIERKQEEDKRKIEENEEKIEKEINNIQNCEMKKIEDIFDCKIGKRVLDKNLLPDGKYKVYSANIFEPFGYLNKPLITDFSKPSILFGIDGDWMVNYIEKDNLFYPTDHCGYLRAKNNNIITKCFTKIIKQAGAEAGFSRQKRASIDRIEQIKIPVPPLQTQQSLLQQINQIEKENEELKNKIDLLEKQKQSVLSEYLK